VTYESAETSVQDSEPRELFTISVNSGVNLYRHTSATRDISWEGVLFTALALQRDEVAITMPGQDKDLDAAGHPAAVVHARGVSTERR
jgi:hypothetical protein